MKTKLIILAVVCNFGYCLGGQVNLQDCQPKTFKVSGYYSPLKGQSFYYRGTYEAEVRLNGGGVHGASGKKVFNGMIAAPKGYIFGTKIYFPHFGVGEVQDRGGAIVKAGLRGNSYDRIDIWMGEGEEGLKRALSFGKREMVGYLCESLDIKSGFDYSKFKIINNFFSNSIWNTYLGPGRNDKRVSVLQKYLVVVGYLSKDNITGNYGNETKDALCKYQVDKGITTKSDEMCGHFGPSTRLYLKKQLLLYKTKKVENIQIGVDDDLVGKTVVTKIKEIKQPIVENKKSQPKVDKKFYFYRSYNNDEKSNEIITLQEFLKNQGYLLEITGIYDTKTINAVAEFQIKNNILPKNDTTKTLGFFGPKTRKLVNGMLYK